MRDRSGVDLDGSRDLSIKIQENNAVHYMVVIYSWTSGQTIHIPTVSRHSLSQTVHTQNSLDSEVNNLIQTSIYV